MVTGFIAFAIMVLLANVVAWSPRRQRSEAREAWTASQTEIIRLSHQQYTRDELLKARRSLGSIMNDAGDLLISQSTNKTMQDESLEIFKAIRNLLRDDNHNPVFDESHVGRFYAVTTRANADFGSFPEPDGSRLILREQLTFLEHVILEINNELNSLPR